MNNVVLSVKGTSRINEPGVRNLRTIRTLQKDTVITCEPGCYFIDKVIFLQSMSYIPVCCNL
jgi:hypothetical protein